MRDKPREIPRIGMGDDHKFDHRIVVHHQRPVGRPAHVKFHAGHSERPRFAKGVEGILLVFRCAPRCA